MNAFDENCLFCRIINKEIPASIIYEDDQVIAIADIAPQAPVHQLILPKKHIATLNDLGEGDKDLMGHMVLVGKKLARKLEIDEAGYRLVLNCNQNGGQAVYHIHLHLLGGRAMQWPPG